ncbi:serine protein kinase [Penicillium mononematosum]|uniref:serine protein kinase n=1 Tax=Penicillium mononematosum TaxID=268346 RepID=UPI00254782DC|nr:serine protein kinase [Penicillium mononematosum]KAJ6184844.1 serine protein kinase [Penicillium mononematosum]
MRRFERIHDVVEPVEEYRAGGYHPVHLGDIFLERYQVIGKWGYGTFSTVWLARDLKKRLIRGRDHIIELLDHFEHTGPNGLHLVLVFPAMLSDGERICERGKPRSAGYIRSISLRIIIALEFLHMQGFVHTGKVSRANHSLSISDMLLPPEYNPVRWLPGVTTDQSAPEYLMVTQRPRGLLDDVDISTLVVKIGDLGAVVHNGDNSSVPVTPLALRAPELLENLPWDFKIDAWSLGCLLFQLATNEPLFVLTEFGCTSDESKGSLKSLILNFVRAGRNQFAVYLRERLPPVFVADNADKLSNFLWSMLQQNPQDRSSMSDLLFHAFLSE